jgi:hypothetical protein
MEDQLDLMLEPLKQYVIGREKDLTDADICFHEIKDKIMEFEKILSKMLDIRLKDSSKLNKIQKPKILKKDKSYKNSKVNKTVDKNKSSNNHKERISWNSYIIDLLKEHGKLTPKELLKLLEDMDLIPKEDGPDKIRITKNARSAIGDCSKKGIIKKAKDGKSWELGPNATN